MATTKKLRRFKRLPTGPNGGIQLMLIQSVDQLGNQGDVVEVKRGYAMNYLLPQGLATIATDHHARMIEKHRSRLMELQKEKIGKLKDLAKVISDQSITIPANANEDGNLYGSVGAPEIVAALKQIDIDINADQLRLEGPLRELGLYTVKVHIYQEIESALKVWVVPEDDDTGAAS
ncbi:MAG: 50S ribosomal protein L9 [Planctomycetaceae bacterium]|nr:50S ribosomal protein L9 [Planctomycetaceae bacterium]